MTAKIAGAEAPSQAWTIRGAEAPRIHQGLRVVLLRTMLIAALGGGYACGQAAADGPWSGNGTLILEPGQWKNFTGPGCAMPGQAECTARPDSLELITDARVWARAKVELPEALRHGNPALGLLMGDRAMYKVYINGQQIGGSGDFETRRGPVNGREIFSVPAELARSGELVIAVESLQVQQPYISAFEPPTRIGRIEELATVRQLDTLQYLHISWLHYLCFLMIFVAGGFFLLLYAMQRQSREYLWLALLFLGLALLRIGEFETVVDVGVGLAWPGLAVAVINILLSVFQIEFVFALIRRRVLWPWRVVQALSVSSQLPVIVTLLPIPLASFEVLLLWTNRLQLIYDYTLIVVALAWLVPLRECWRSRDWEMKWMGAALIFLSVEEFSRYATEIGLPGLPQDMLMHGVDVDLRALALFLFSVVMVVTMTVRYRRIATRAQSVEMELAAARSVQQVLIPDEMPKIAGLEIASVYRPAQEVGGDFFQVLPLAGGACFVVIGDVSGKGMQAAMTVSLLVGTLRTAAETTDAPGLLMAALNRRLHGRGTGFTTCVAMRIDADGMVTAANAGHLQPYLDGREMAMEAGLPLGFDVEAEFAETRFALKGGERLALVTDGVVEAMNVKKELFGFARTEAVSGETAEEIAGAAEGFGVGVAQADDITVLTVVRAVAA